MALKILLYGKPGSGKDTQGEILAKSFGLAHFSGGQILRDEIAQDTETGRLVRPFVEQGLFVPKGVVTDLIKKKILASDVQASGYVVQGYPRSQESFSHYLEYDTPTHIFVLEVSDEDVRKRLVERGRADDIADRIDRRLAEFSANDVPLLTWLKEQMPDRVHIIAGNQTPEETAEEIQKYIEQAR